MPLFTDFSPNANLELHDGGDPSPLEDFITMFIKGPFNSRSRVRLQFRGGLPDNRRTAIFEVPIENRAQPSSTLGLASLLEVQNQVADLLARDRFAGLSDEERLNASIAEKTWLIPIDEWQFLAVPKRSFVLANGFVWTSVSQFGIFWGVPDGTYCLSDLLMVGGGRDNGGGAVTPPGGNGSASNGGLQGTYKYKITFFNSETGNRSNGSASTKVAENVNRGWVQLTGIPTAADPQVTDVEIWRTVGNGIEFFKIGEVTNGTATFDDEVADHSSLDSTDGTAIMTTLQLPEDNDVPSATFDNCIIDRLTAFWISNEVGQQGQVSYSPAGRPESLKGFFNAGQAGDPLHRLVVLNSQRYVFSEARAYRIDGDDPYIAREIGGVPGVQFAQRRTVVATPVGIMYQATDGVRLFNGATSTLVGFDAIGRIFRGEATEGLPAFEGTNATFSRGEYLISDGTRTLAFNISAGGWRDVGFNDITALFYEWDSDKLVGGRAGNTQLLEEEGTVTDAGSSIPFEWETPAVDAPNDQLLLVQRVFVDIDANGQTVTATLVHRFGSETLGTVSEATRVTREFEQRRLFLKPSLRFSGSATDRVVLYDAELDVQPLVMEIRTLQGPTVSIGGRYREGISADGSIYFTIEPGAGGEEDTFNQTDRLFIIDRLTVEANTGSQAMAVNVTLDNTVVNIGSVNTSVRDTITFDLDRVGPLNEVRLDGPFFGVATEAQVYRVIVHVRELELGLRVGPEQSRRVTVPARSAQPSANVVFEVPPPFRLFDDYAGVVIIQRILYDINTAGVNVTPSLLINGGATTISPGVINNSQRATIEQDIDRLGPLQQIELAADFIANAIALYAVEVVFLPVELGIKRIDGQPLAGNSARLSVPGRMPDPTTGLVFEVQPVIQILNQQDGLFWVDRLVVEADTNGATVTVNVDFGGGSVIAVGTVNTTTRGYVEIIVQRPAPIRTVTLSADFTTDIQIFGVEFYVRPVVLGIKNVDTGTRAGFTGRMIDGSTEILLTVNPEQRIYDGQVGAPRIQHLYLDIDTNSFNVTPEIVTGARTIALGEGATASRETVVYEIMEVGDIQEVKLTGDFVGNPIGLYGVELSVDEIELGVQVLTGE